MDLLEEKRKMEESAKIEVKGKGEEEDKEWQGIAGEDKEKK